jgi:hypothetical protein
MPRRKNKTTFRRVARDAKTGRFITLLTALHRPATTVVERVWRWMKRKRRSARR